MALNTCEMLSNGTKTAFSQKITTKCPAAAWGFAPRPPSVIRLSYSSLLQTFPNSDIFKPSPLSKIPVKCQKQATASDLPFYNIFVPQKVLPLKISENIIVCDSWFGSPPPNQKSWGRLCAD